MVLQSENKKGSQNLIRLPMQDVQLVCHKVTNVGAPPSPC